jgi:hypothetical protein
MNYVPHLPLSTNQLASVGEQSSMHLLYRTEVLEKGGGGGGGGGELFTPKKSGSNLDPGFPIFRWPKTEEEKKQQKFFEVFFDQILQFTDVQATGEAFNPQKRTSRTSKN